MAIAGGDHAEAVGIVALLRLQQQARQPGIAHVASLHFAQGAAATEQVFQQLETCPFIVG